MQLKPWQEKSYRKSRDGSRTANPVSSLVAYRSTGCADSGREELCFRGLRVRRLRSAHQPRANPGPPARRGRQLRNSGSAAEAVAIPPANPLEQGGTVPASRRRIRTPPASEAPIPPEAGLPHGIRRYAGPDEFRTNRAQPSVRDRRTADGARPSDARDVPALRAAPAHTPSRYSTSPPRLPRKLPHTIVLSWNLQLGSAPLQRQKPLVLCFRAGFRICTCRL